MRAKIEQAANLDGGIRDIRKRMRRLWKRQSQTLHLPKDRLAQLKVELEILKRKRQNDWLLGSGDHSL